MTEPIISSYKELSLASARDIKNSNIDGTPTFAYYKRIDVPQDSYRSSLIAPQTRLRNKY